MRETDTVEGEGESTKREIAKSEQERDCRGREQRDGRRERDGKSTETGEVRERLSFSPFFRTQPEEPPTYINNQVKP